MGNKQKNNILLNILPEAASAMSAAFQNTPFSPGRVHKLRSYHNTTKCYKGTKRFSCPMIPNEARRRMKDDDVETAEPTSPKISCMGHIKQKKKHTQKANAKIMSLSTSHNTKEMCDVDSNNTEVIKKKHRLNKFQRMFFHAAKWKTGSRKKLSSDLYESVVGKGNYSSNDTVSNIAPPMGDMKRFSSGHESFTNFDWKGQIVPDEMDRRVCLTDVEEDDDDEFINSFSEPVLVRGCSGRYNDLNLQPPK
ncbi:hypothetical protein Lal_00019146 [Lupinus albus]|uniref:Uncharacterized protein n=1 Tax=Lupinus albus TaxID=3870 RepID=A0A6A5PM06_LUPAL|nr:hypothetical protein Lalb_Chr01g0008491 [Lupinus albus]KAF1899025.1 hypothetical protein Lal_00019146 [Lupinus albus]